MKGRFVYLAMAISLGLILIPFFREEGKMGWFLGTLLIAAIPLAAVYALEGEKRPKIIICLLTAPMVILDMLNTFFASPALIAIMHGFSTIPYLYIVIQLVKHILSRTTITGDMIFCAICIYLMIGFMWTGPYVVMEIIDPHSFAGISGVADLTYFSFATLTTVGYGDVAPVSNLAKRLSVLEAATGSIYMAIIVALVVGKYLSKSLEQESSK